MVYDYTGPVPGSETTNICFDINGSGQTGECYTTQGGGQNKKDYSGWIDPIAGFGLFSITGSTMSLSINGSANRGVDGGDYSLTANFDEDGGFTGGSITILGSLYSGDDFYPQFQSGTLLTGNLFNFGFGGEDAAGIFEFEIDTLGGDMAAFGDALQGGVIAGPTLDSSYGGDWDPLLDNNPAFWQQSFTASGNVDTYVPLPAAVWLFGSGLLGLAGFARRKK
jgi:hypothetical protein